MQDSYFEKVKMVDVVVDSFEPGTWEAKKWIIAHWVRGQPGLPSEKQKTKVKDHNRMRKILTHSDTKVLNSNNHFQLFKHMRARDDSVGKSRWHTAWWHARGPWDPPKARRKASTPQSCPLTFTHLLWQMCHCSHTQTRGCLSSPSYTWHRVVSNCYNIAPTGKKNNC